MHLVLATEAQKAERDRVTHSIWGSPLTVEQFHQRELRLRAHPWCRYGMRTWLLVDDNGRVLASCETFHNDSFLMGTDGRLSPSESFSIASVFTEEHLRGQGHATRLMELLAAELERTSPRAHAAVLFSDVGAALYRRAGYQEVPAWDWNVFTGEAPVPRRVSALLRDGEVAETLDRMRRPEAQFYLWPSAAQVDWHLERERIYSELLGRPRPEACGAVVGDSAALWAMMARYGELVVLLMDARTDEDAAVLLETARGVAHRAGLPKVVVWEEPHTAARLARIPGALRVAREGSLPMLRPLRLGLPRAHTVPFPRALWV